ncbi:MAG: hypothetical protein IJB05_10430 [Bacteroidales bacterium]|nr:hypothetical protein [Bacteroidales bacterium]
MENHKKHIMAVIEKTLSKLNSLYHRDGGGLENTRLIFPRYWVTKEGERVEGELRVSEQELRFMFVEELNKYCDAHREWEVYYSVETPTSNSYQLTGEGQQSGCIDLCIHGKDFKRIALIEFKALNPSEHAHAKDAFKLKHEIEGELRYFIEIVKSHDSKTDESIVEKLKAKKGYKAHTMDCSHPVSYIVASFKGEQEEIIATDVIE